MVSNGLLHTTGHPAIAAHTTIRNCIIAFVMFVSVFILFINACHGQPGLDECWMSTVLWKHWIPGVPFPVWGYSGRIIYGGHRSSEIIGHGEILGLSVRGNASTLLPSCLKWIMSSHLVLSPKFITIKIGIPSWIQTFIWIPSWIVDPSGDCSIKLMPSHILAFTSLSQSNTIRWQSYSLDTLPVFRTQLYGLRYAKRSLMSWVIVIPKHGRPSFGIIWHLLFRFFFFFEKHF